MYDANDLLRLVKKSSKDAMNATYPATVLFGTVEEEVPLKIYVEQRFHLTEKQLIVPQHLTDYKVEIILNGESRTITIKNALKLRDKVVLISEHGGQKYFIADKVV